MVISWKACPWQSLTFASMSHGIYLVKTIVSLASASGIFVFVFFHLIYLPEYFYQCCFFYLFLFAGKSIIKLAGQVTWYFLCPRDLRGKVHRRKTKAGYWKLTCQQKSITAEGTTKKIGVMRTLRFYENEVRTGWMMYEFDLITNSSQFKKVLIKCHG